VKIDTTKKNADKEEDFIYLFYVLFNNALSSSDYVALIKKRIKGQMKQQRY
jgi:hypothetical protein